jgi:hypothetical protein
VVIDVVALLTQGHSVTRKLNSDGKMDTLQTLHNLNEGLFPIDAYDWYLKRHYVLCNCLAID